MSILSFLDNYRCKGTGTHSGWYPTLGSFNIPEEQYGVFFEAYTTAFMKGETLGLTELHERYSPILIDIDIKYELDEGYVRRYKQDDIKMIIKLYNEQLRTFFEITDPEMLKAYVFEKPQPTKTNGNMKDGIHIMYPNIISEPDIQYMIRENIVEYVDEHNLFTNWNAKNKTHDIFDKNIIESAGWILYGGSKVGQKPYELTYIVDEKLNIIDELPEKMCIPKMFSIRGHKNETKLSSKGEQCRNKKEKKIAKTNIKQNMMYKFPAEPEDVDLAKKLVAILNKERADDHKTWLDVGFCLFNIDVNLLDAWVEFSKTSCKYKDGECEKLWASFKHKGLSIASLHRWAKIDNKEEYEKVVDVGSRNALIESLSGTNYDVAKVLYKMYKYQYVCTTVRQSIWYEYKGHRWVEIENGMSLKQKISTILAKKYRLLQIYYTNKLLDCEDEVSKKQIEEKMDQAKKLVKYVKDTTFKTKIMSECVELFYDPNFLSKLDSQPHLLGFENGVFDLDCYEFRDGCPEDYISFSTKCDYKQYNDHDIKIKEVYNFMKQIHTNQELREYTLLLMASFLDGRCYEQKFHFWLGNGANGKSTLVELFEDSLGDYAASAPNTILTRPRGNASNANPEIAKLKGKRFVHTQETEATDQLHVGYLKELTGGDKIIARELYKSPIQFKPQFKFILACNELPGTSGNDDGVWRRLRVINFKSKFVNQPVHENEFKKDPDLNDKLHTWHESFVSILLHYYSKFRFNKHTIVEPEEVVSCTRKYQQENDSMLDYINECIEVVDDKKERLGISVIYPNFSEWYRSGYNEKPPPKKQLKEYLIKKFGAMKTCGFIGLRFKEESYL